MTAFTIHQLRRAAIAYLFAGLGFLVFGFPFWFLHAVDEAPQGKFYPPFFYLVDDRLMAPVANWFQHISSLGMLVGVISLWRAGEPTGLGPRKKLLFVPMAGACSYILAIWLLLPFAPLGAFLNGLGMILVGIATLRVKVWTDWKRYIPLMVGLFPFLFMFPLVLITGARPAAVIGFWGLAWLLLGFAAWQRANELAATTSLQPNAHRQ